MRREIEALDELFQQHRGIVSRTVLGQIFTRRQIERFADAGRIIRVYQGVYRPSGVQLDRRQLLRAALVAAGDGAFASYRSACELWNVWLPTNATIEISVPRGRSARMPGVTVHRSTLPTVLVAEIHGIAVTSPERTLLEISSFRGDDTARKVLEDLVIRRIVSLDRLFVAYELLKARGRRRFGVWSRVLADLPSHLSKVDTNGELRALKAWQRAGLPLPDPQHKVIVNGVARYFDFAYPDLKVAIECDGRLTHDVLRSARDKASDRYLGTCGWLILRFPDSTPDHVVVQDVRLAIASRSMAS